MVAASVGAVLAWAVLIPALALGHLERPSYWPDPSPERVDGIDVGGAVPKAQSLGSALKASGPSELHVACQGKDGRKSLDALKDSIADAKKGWTLRPSQGERDLSNKKAKYLKKTNRKLAKECEYKSVQDAVNAADNHDRVVVMPGHYKEPQSRRQPTNDPKCAEMTQQDSGGAETPSFRYQATCPNDQNLIYVQGREVPETPPPEPPLEDRQGIPDLGPCARCGLQLEGSGVKPEDVILDAAKDYDGKGAEAKPGDFAKDVVLRVDRADGFIGKNFLARGAKEHGVYVEEVDGYRIDKVKMFWAADYGNLTFTSDHGLYKNCDGFGAGDAVLYPGAAPETGEQADKSFYPDAPRINTTVKKCDMRGSVLGYSGSMGNAVRITNNHIYGNVAGISTDTISAGGHPGYPADSVEVDNNLIYSNNLELYTDNPPVEPVVGVLPNGVGIFWAGHNNGRVHDNWIFDNWRYGSLLLAIPDAVIEATGSSPEGSVNPGISCPTAPDQTTSCGNQYFDNHLGVAPPDFEPSKAVTKFGNQVGGTEGVLPNGIDFWWDEFAGNTGNCWFNNQGPDGTNGSVTGPGPGAPPDVLPSDCATSNGGGDSAKEAQLTSCFLAREFGGPPEGCDWYELPPQPGTDAASRRDREITESMRDYALSDDAGEFERYFRDLHEDFGG